MISKGYLYNIVIAHDQDSKIPSIESVPVLREFPKVFAIDLPGIPPKWEIDFGIDLLPDANHISFLLIRWIQTN